MAGAPAKEQARPHMLRRAGPRDLAAVVRVTEEAYAPHTARLGRPPLPVTEDYAQRIDDGGVWLLEEGDALAGLIVLERGRDHVMIFSIAVAPEFQGKRLGIRLLEFAEEQARDAGFGEVRLYTNAKMERNIALYEAFGYREAGRRANPKREGWVIVDMAKTLGV